MTPFFFFFGQASALERLVADAAELIKHTGRFYDQYTEMHKASSTGGPGNAHTGPGKSLGTFRSGYCPNCRATGAFSATAAEGQPRAEPHANATHLRGMQQALGVAGSTVYGIGIGSSCHFAETSGTAPAATAAAAAGSPPWGSGENSRTFLGRAGAEGAAAAAGGRRGPAREVDMRELDQRCYSLLESNARLCLRLQGLGLEYAGLVRELLRTAEEVRNFAFFLSPRHSGATMHAEPGGARLT